MYNLGEQFKIDRTKTVSKLESIVQGNKYRITVLSERLVRLEYSEEGIFNDLPTELVLYRDFEVPKFNIKQNKSLLQITTPYFKLTYLKEKPFVGNKINPTANLKIDLQGSDRVWYYHHPEARTYATPYLDLMTDTGKNKGIKSLYSLDGFVSLDDSETPIIDEDGTLKRKEHASIDIYVFLYLDDFVSALKDYFTLTGAPPLLPRYAFGNWWARNLSYNDYSLSKLVSDFDKEKIPVSIFLLNPDWHIRTYQKQIKLRTGFTFNSEKFKNPQLLVQNLHNRNIRLGLNINPLEGFYPFEPYYEKAKEYLGVDKKGIVPFQVLDPKAIDVYLKLFIHPLDNLGIDFYFIDTNGKDAQKLWVLNHYHSYDMMRDNRRRALLLTKNAAIAPHRYPVLYSGQTIVSWDTLKQIPFHNGGATSMGVSFWAHDIGGYHKGTEDNELYTRFVQLGTFSPILKFGSDEGKYYKREPWKWGVKTYEIVKDYLTLRHRMIPYLYTEAYYYHKNAIPMVIPIYYNFPDLYDNPLYHNEYYFGSQLFVAPIVSKKDYIMNRVIHRFFVPDGTWYDFVTGKKFPGGKPYISFFKDNEYPVFAREGSILVLGDNKSINDTNPPKNMEIQIFPGKSNSYTLYEDDGLTDYYKQGFYIKTNIDYNYLPNNYTVIVRPIEGRSGIIPDERNYKFRFRNTKESEDVSVYLKDTPIPFKSYVDGTDFIVEVENVNTIKQLTINCKGQDIEIDAVRIINEDIESILSDLQIETEMKEKVDAVFFSDVSIKKKRIMIRKLSSKGLERKFIQLFLKLLDYVGSM